jgi:hypothetical protein
VPCLKSFILAQSERRTIMYGFKRIALFGLLALFGAVAIITPHTGFGQNPNQNGATSLNCDQPPCDAVARGRAAFNDRNLATSTGSAATAGPAPTATCRRRAFNSRRRLPEPGSMRCRPNASTTRMRTIRSSAL